MSASNALDANRDAPPKSPTAAGVGFGAHAAWWFVLWATIALLALTGAVTAFRGQLDFFEYLTLRLHRYAAVFFTFFFLLGYTRWLGVRLASRTIRVAYPALCLILPPLLYTQYLIPQMAYGIAVVSIGLLLAYGLRRGRPVRFAPAVWLALWLAGFAVVVNGWFIVISPSLRHNFYSLAHRYAALAFAVLAPIVLPRSRPMRIRQAIRMPLAGTLCAALLLGVVWTRADRLAAQFPRRAEPLAPAPIRLDLTDAAAGRPLLTEPGRLESSSGCSARDCHKILYDQWRISPHRLAGKTEPYKHLVRRLIKEKGPEAAVFCSRCHTPLLAMLGIPDNPDDPTQERWRDEGVSCQYCHIASGVGRPLANGNLLVEFGRDHLEDYADSEELERYRSSFIMSNIMPHRNLYRKPVQKQPEFCGACHRAEMPPELTDGRTMVLGDTHTPWVSSKAAMQDITCHSCHMALTITEIPKADYRAVFDEMHAYPDHRLVGTCQSLALLVPEEHDLASKYDQVVVQQLLGDIEIPVFEYYYLWIVRDARLRALKHLKGQRPIKLRIAAAPGASPDERALTVVTANNTFAHILPSGPLDLNEIWLDLRVTDAKGRPIAATPGLDQRHLLSPAAVRLGADLLDKEGQRILDHRFWAAERVINKQILDLDQPRTDAFRFRVPPDAAFPLQAEAAWRYRRYNQNMADAVYGAGRVTFPVVELGSATAQIER